MRSEWQYRLGLFKESRKPITVSLQTHYKPQAVRLGWDGLCRLLKVLTAISLAPWPQDRLAQAYQNPRSLYATNSKATFSVSQSLGMCSVIFFCILREEFALHPGSDSCCYYFCYDAW